jgi:signal transduction histidine kinase
MYPKNLLKIQDKIQKEFIDVAAHELRTPIQPIIAIMEILYSQNKNGEHQELLGVIMRNAKRLKRLSEDLLDVAKIESNTLKLNKDLIFKKKYQVLLHNIKLT